MHDIRAIYLHKNKLMDDIKDVPVEAPAEEAAPEAAAEEVAA